MVDIAFLGEHRCKLGESPLWDMRNQCLWWVDARAMAIFAAKPDGTLLSRCDYAELPGSIALAEGGLLVAFADRFCLMDAADLAVRNAADLSLSAWLDLPSGAVVVVTMALGCAVLAGAVARLKGLRAPPAPHSRCG